MLKLKLKRNVFGRGKNLVQMKGSRRKKWEERKGEKKGVEEDEQMKGKEDKKI